MTTILQEALQLVNGDRNEAYGNPKAKYEVIAALWSAVLGFKVEPRQVILCMIATKLGRESMKHKRDNLVDLSGYCEVLGVIEDEQ